MKLLQWGPVAATAVSLFALTEAFIRGVDYLRTPPSANQTLSSLELWMTLPTLGWVFLILGLTGILCAIGRQWVAVAFSHVMLAGIFMAMGLVSLGSAWDLGYTFRAPVSYLLIFTAVHIFSVDAFFDRWMVDRARRLEVD